MYIEVYLILNNKGTKVFNGGQNSFSFFFACMSEIAILLELADKLRKH